MKQVIVYFPTFDASFGGSEYLPLLFIEELQRRGHPVTLALDWPSDVAAAAQAYEIAIDFSKLAIVVLKPSAKWKQRLDSVIPVWTVRRLQRLAKDCDVCISAANMIDFGKPGHHFIYLLNRFGDNAFTDYVRHTPPPAGLARWMRRLRTFAAEAILRPLFSVRSARKMLADPRERFYTNSEYVANVMRGFYGTFNNRLFYPPTIFEPTPGDEGRQPNKVVYLGRLTPLKGIRELILVVEKARRISGADLVFELAGCLPASAYAEEIKEMFRSRPWVRHVGEKYGSDKRAFLASGTYALHACREEAFGISVTEYLKAGVLPIVPDEGGSPEIAAAEELVFRDYDTAAAKLAALVQDPALHERLVSHCRSRAGMFAREAYLARQHELFEGILAGS